MAQRTILQIAQAVNTELGFPKPMTVVSSTDTNVIKLLALITATCEDLMNEFDCYLLFVLIDEAAALHGLRFRHC
jgi:hypothetical protein